MAAATVLATPASPSFWLLMAMPVDLLVGQPATVLQIEISQQLLHGLS